MKKAQYIARLMVLVMVLSLIPNTLRAEAIESVDEIFVEVLNRPAQNEIDRIVPDLTVSWTGTTQNSVEIDGRPSNNKYYQMRIRNLTTGEESYSSKNSIKDKTTVDLSDVRFGYNLYGDTFINEEFIIENGQAYEIEVFVVFERTYNAEGERDPRYKYSLGNKIAYFVTDIEPSVEVLEEGIELEFPYIKDAVYKIVYEKEDHLYKQDFSDEAIKNAIRKTYKESDVQNGKVQFLLEDIIPGQIYSFYVAVEEIQGIHELFYNQKDGRNGPKVVQTIPRIKIDSITKHDYKYIDIRWRMPDWINDEEDYTVTIKATEKESGITTRPWTFKKDQLSQNAKHQYSVLIPIPNVAMIYELEFRFKDGKTGFNSYPKEYTPDDVRQQPLKPKIPHPYSKELAGSTELMAQLGLTVSDFLVSGDRARPLEDKDFKENTFYSKVREGDGLQLAWDIPKKQGRNDYELYYDLWIGESLDALEGDATYSNITFSKQDTEHLIYKYGTYEPVGFKMNLGGKKDSVFKIVPNKTYYIKMIAKRAYGEEDFEISEPTTVNITITKNGDIAVPPVLGKPPLKVESTTQTTATIVWRENWYEILTKDTSLYEEKEKILAELGSGKIYVPDLEKIASNKLKDIPEPFIRFKYLDQSTHPLKPYILINQEDVNKVKEDITKIAIAQGKQVSNQVHQYYNDYYYERYQQLGENIGYELKYVPLGQVQDELEGNEEITSIEEWVMNQNETSDWQDIDPEEGIGEQKDWKLHTLEGLEANTKYVIMLRAYRDVEGQKMPQRYPSYVIATTKTDHVTPDPIPKVPVLYPVKDDSGHIVKGDTYFDVWFEYNSAFTYELVYSRKDNPDEATIFPINISDDPKSEHYVPNGGRKEVRIHGLFPETYYNAWIRIIEYESYPRNSGKGWSNPVSTTTDQVKAPQKPTGLGPAAYQSIVDLGLDFKPVDKNHITVEWTLNPNDQGTVVEGSIEKSYVYVLEFADNVEFLDSKTLSITDESVGTTMSGNIEILGKNIVKFNELTSNRPYYFRVKTRIILKDTESDHEISKESEFTSIVRILTKRSDDEYDSGENENIVIYPESIEETYRNGTWTWEIIDAQTVISEIITSNKYLLTVDLTAYNGRHDALVRKVRVPRNVWDALLSQRMALRVITSTATYDIPASSLGYATRDMKPRDIIELEFTRVFGYDIHSIIKPYPYKLQSGEQLSIRAEGKPRNMTTFDENIQVEMNLENHISNISHNLQIHTYDIKHQEWFKEGTSLSFSTRRIGIYGLYHLEEYKSPSQTNWAMQQLSGTYYIEGLGTTYGKEDFVEPKAYTLLMLGIVQDKNHIRLEGMLPIDMKNKAERSRLYQGDYKNKISYEEAISGVVRLYELKTGIQIKPSSKVFKKVSLPYRESISKAYALGLIEDIEPQKSINYGKLCELILSVLP